MKREEILRRVDHTLLEQEAVWEEIRALLCRWKQEYREMAG